MSRLFLVIVFSLICPAALCLVVGSRVPCGGAATGGTAGVPSLSALTKLLDDYTVAEPTGGDKRGEALVPCCSACASDAGGEGRGDLFGSGVGRSLGKRGLYQQHSLYIRTAGGAVRAYSLSVLRHGPINKAISFTRGVNRHRHLARPILASAEALESVLGRGRLGKHGWEVGLTR